MSRRRDPRACADAEIGDEAHDPPPVDEGKPAGNYAFIVDRARCRPALREGIVDDGKPGIEYLLSQSYAQR